MWHYNFLLTLPGQIVRSLLEAEKWELALEIATKSGLPRNSVLAAWGKACLKAGCFKEARKKFAHCFKGTTNISIDEGFEYGKEASETPILRRSRGPERSASSTSQESRTRANPPLLNEIISMLEDMNYPVNQQLLSKAETIKVRLAAQVNHLLRTSCILVSKHWRIRTCGGGVECEYSNVICARNWSLFLIIAGRDTVKSSIANYNLKYNFITVY